MLKQLAAFAALSTLCIATGVQAQNNVDPTLRPIEGLRPPIPELVKPPLEIDVDLTKGAGQRARAAGCISSQVYNTQNVNRYSTAFTVATSDGDKSFNFEASHIKHIPPGAGIPLPTREETLKWERVITTLEKAAMNRNQILIDYTDGNNQVFGFFVLWDSKCAD